MGYIWADSTEELYSKEELISKVNELYHDLIAILNEEIDKIYSIILKDIS